QFVPARSQAQRMLLYAVGVTRLDGKICMLTWSLVTVTYNSADDLVRFWSGFDGAPSGCESTVGDNASSDGSADAAGRLGAVVIRQGKTLGFSAAKNIGFQRSSGEYVAFVNPDVEARFDGLEVLREHLAENPTHLVSPQLVNTDGTPQPNGRGMPYLAHKVLNRVAPRGLEGTYLRTAEPDE